MFYFPQNEDDKAQINETLTNITTFYNNQQIKTYFFDNLFAIGRNLHFLSDYEFREALFRNCLDQNLSPDPTEIAKAWRIHTYVWACTESLKLDGAILECGVHLGTYSMTMLDILKDKIGRKPVFLYDTFAGLDPRYADEAELRLNSDYEQIEDWHELVKKRFAKFPTATVIKGVVPDILAETAPAKIAMLHLDMNAAKAERAAIEFLYDRLVDGAYILMDDFGRQEHEVICETMKDFFQGKNHQILELPSGQGLVIKRSA